MSYIFPPHPISALPIIGNDKEFPIRRIFCVGRNYAEHALEMGGDPTREAPFFFSKPADTLVQNGATISYPQATENFHFEMELVIAIGKEGKNVPLANAPEYIFGYASGIDLTRRDLQKQAKEKGRPWDSAKGFDQSAPCSAITPAYSAGDLSSSKIWLDVNGIRKQEAMISDMIWSPVEIVSHLSALYKIFPGDLIYSGTPAGVGPLIRKNFVEGGIDCLEIIRLTIE